MNDDINSPNSINEKLEYINSNKSYSKRNFKELTEFQQNKIKNNIKIFNEMDSINHYKQREEISDENEIKMKIEKINEDLDKKKQQQKMIYFICF